MESTELMVTTNNQNLYISPIVGIEDAKAKFETVRKYTANCLTKGIDFGTVSGVAKPSLLKPGAEKICSLFGLTPKFTCVDKTLSWNGDGNPDSEPFFYFEYRCDLYRGGEFVASCDASCNSWEKKYRYRKADLVCPVCGKPSIIKGREEYGGGWLCYKKSGRCGAKFGDSDPQITNQKAGLVKNFDTAEQVNTFQKMAQKRAFVGATLIACNLSEYYTQDIEDMAPGSISHDVADVVDGEYTPVQIPAQKQQTANQQKSAQFDEVRFLREWQEKATVIVGDSHVALPEISLETACNLDTTNKDGTVVKMGKRGVGQLAGMWKVYKQKLSEPDADQETILMKLSAVNAILTAKAKAQADLDSIM